MKKFVYVALVLIILPSFAFAQTIPTNACSSGNTSLPRCINQIYIWSLGAAAILALLMIVVGGYITLTAAGNAQQASRGKNYIVSSLVGLVLIFGAYILLRTINPDLVDFSGNCINDLSQCTKTEQSQTTTPPTTPTK